MIDKLGRDITYLRISLTDKCNLRCRYCMPEEGVCKRNHSEMMTEDEVITAVKVAASLGITKIRLTGGELPACVFADCVSRMVEGVLSSPECFEDESIECGMLEHPQYTRPVEFMGRAVPEVLMSGDHEKIKKWRYLAALELTKKNRPDRL